MTDTQSTSLEPWLLAGETISLDDAPAEPMGSLTNDQINDKYVKGEIRIVTEQARYPISAVAEIVESPSYRISPEYQRRHRWANERKSRLVESLIMNVPIPPIFLYEYEYSKYEVMDGLQRLTAIHDYYKDKFALEGLVEWPELNGRKYSKLPVKVKEGIDRRYLSSVILLKETAKNELEALRLKQLVFERINSGGVRLEPQETRNAIYDGRLNQLCIRLSRNASLCRLWGIPLATPEEIKGGAPSEERVENESFRKMEDVELVLRFFAYRQKHRLQRSGQSLRVYLDNFLRKGNFLDEKVLAGVASEFEQAISLAEGLFGESAFHLFRKRMVGGQEAWSWLERPTTTAYDPLLFVLSKFISQRDMLLQKKEQINADREAFFKENYDIFEGRNVNPSALTQRESMLEGYFSRYLEKQ